MGQPHLKLKLAISVGAAILILLHLFVPALEIDIITLGLLVVLILPWLSALIKSAEFPGGWKVEFHELQSAGEKITAGSEVTTDTKTAPRPSYIEVANNDPNLALVGLRIEVEKRVRQLAKKYGLQTNPFSLNKLTNELKRMGVLDSPRVSGLQDLIIAGNRAAHGAEVDNQVAQWAMEMGPQILATLDELIEEKQ